MRQIKMVACEVYGIRMSELVGPTHERHVVRARHMAMYLCRKTIGASYPAIGRAFNRDHSTVLVAVRNVSAAIRVDAEMQRLRDIVALEVDSQTLAAHQKKCIQPLPPDRKDRWAHWIT